MKRGDALIRTIACASCALAALGLFAANAGAQQRAYDPKQAFQETDTNHDGSIELDEFSARLIDVFFMGDTNKDGKLSKEEYDAVVVIREDFSAADHDKDGFVSRTEFIRARLPLFQQADKNEDGVLSLEEVTTLYEAKKK
jgi:Ca2+-binding EF-hand superfamily protein